MDALEQDRIMREVLRAVTPETVLSACIRLVEIGVSASTAWLIVEKVLACRPIGRTPDSDSEDRGSNPCMPAK